MSLKMCSWGSGGIQKGTEMASPCTPVQPEPLDPVGEYVSLHENISFSVLSDSFFCTEILAENQVFLFTRWDLPHKDF